MSQQSNHFYEFGPYRLDAAERLLRRDGEAVALQPKVFDLLIVLVEHPGRLLEKDDLMKLVWPDTIVEEANLTNNVSILRKALGEGNEGRPFIETVPKRGYRFVGPVEELKDEPTDLAVAERSGSLVVVAAPEDSVVTATEQEVAPLAETPAWSIRRGMGRWTKRQSRLTVWASSLLLIGLASVVGTRLSKRPTASSVTGVGINSIAVLPFKLLVTASRDESLELGMTETLITKLNSIRQLIVRPLSAVRQYTNFEQDPLAAGREQRVEAVLEGSIQRSDEKIRVTVRLLKISDGALLWADKFDEKFTDIFAVQDSISERVAAALRLKLTREEQRLLGKRYTESVEAYQLYAMGRYYMRTRQTKEGWEKGIEYFDGAIKKDPGYALAYVGLAWSYANLGRLGYWLPQEAWQKSEWAALKAVELDGSLGDGHALLGYIKKWEWDWSGAEKEFKRALELAPNSVEANSIYASYLTDIGRTDEGIVYKKRAQELDPMTPEASGHLANSYFMSRQYDKAIELFVKTVEMDPNLAPAHSRLGQVYLQKGMFEEAIAELQKAMAIESDPARWDRDAALSYAYALSGRRGEARKILDKLNDLSKQRYIPPFNFAVVYIGLGEKNEAFKWLDKAYKERSQLLTGLKVDPLFDSLHSDPRFTDLLQRMNLAP
jgi:DNA-binding winged helix-turn-helix (wHTH) protein/TolB-like protein/Flp pilus assembly protein TadD